MGFIHNEMRQLKRQCVWIFFPYFLFTSLTDTFSLPHKIDRKKSNMRVKIRGCFIIRLPMAIVSGPWVFQAMPSKFGSAGALFYKRELWVSKSVGFNSTKSLKICGCKR